MIFNPLYYLLSLIFGYDNNFSEFILSFLLLWLCAVLFTLTIFLFIARWKLFEKAGYKGYLSLIPIYSNYVFMCKICGIHWVFLLLRMFSLLYSGFIYASILILSMCFYNLAKKFNVSSKSKLVFDTIFGVVMIFVFSWFKKYEYNSNIKVSNCGYFNDQSNIEEDDIKGKNK